MISHKRVATRKQSQTVTTVHAKDPSSLPERLKKMVEELEEEPEVEMKKEKEKKYYVMNHKGATMLAKTPSGEIACSNCSDLTSVRDEYLERYQLTEKEIKSVDERYWAFAEEVTDRSLEDWGKWQYHMGETARKKKIT